MFKNRLLLALQFLTIVNFLINPSCAVPKQPEGGADDKTPPRIDSSSYSTPNFKTKFNEKEIILTFDEWIKIKNQAGIVVSPYMAQRPEVKIKHKSLVLSFKESLKPNTTYSVELGGSISDITKDNALGAYRYVFSTGDKIDSSEVKGFLKDAQGDPLPDNNLWAFLYDNTDPVSFRKQTPLYIAQIDKDGSFTLPNLRKDTFRIVALEDINANFKYDLPNEKIAFSEKPFISGDSSAKFFNLRLFEVHNKLRVAGIKSDKFGRLTVSYNYPPDNYPTINIVGNETFIKTREDDGGYSRLWYETNPAGDSAVLKIPELDTTITVMLGNKSDFLKSKPVLGISDTKISQESGGKNAKNTVASKGKQKEKQLAPNQPLTMSFSHPIASIDTSKMVLKKDTTVLPIKNSVQWSFLDKKLILNAAWKHDTTYILELKPGAVTDIFGLKNDTLFQPFKALKDKELGNIDAKLTGVKTDEKYIVSLLDGDKNILKTDILNGTDSINVRYEKLIPGSYTLKVIKDANANGKWDSGDYDLMRQPEEVLISDPLTLKPNWDGEILVALIPENKKVGKKGLK